jgi:uncharacterized Zn finger protein
MTVSSPGGLRRCPQCGAGAIHAVVTQALTDGSARAYVQCEQCGTWRRAAGRTRPARA